MALTFYGSWSMFAFSWFISPHGRALHSSTSQLNLSRFWSLKPQPASTSQLNLRRFCRYDLWTQPTKSAPVKPKSPENLLMLS